MLDPEFLKILRCPFDPRREAALSQPDESKLVCSCCQVTFPVRDGFPILLVDEAQLPPGCSGQDQLACQKGQS